jgi:hypothetical protein
MTLRKVGNDITEDMFKCRFCTQSRIWQRRERNRGLEVCGYRMRQLDERLELGLNELREIVEDFDEVFVHLTRR